MSPLSRIAASKQVGQLEWRDEAKEERTTKTRRKTLKKKKHGNQ
jgi:hypothetical protein